MAKGGRGKKSFFWHVPPGGWYESGPSPTGGVLNVGNDIVVPLIDVETVIAAKPELDSFVVERIIGQYHFTGSEAPLVNRYLHHRVYKADADATSFTIRNLQTEDDAESSFLWHQVDPFSTDADGRAYGQWGMTAAGNPDMETFMGRRGHLDIRVGRRVDQGEALIWHTRIFPAPAANDVYALKLWIRLLVREG